MNRTVTITLAMLVFSAAAARAAQADQPPAPAEKKAAVQAAKPAPGTGTPGAMVFIDPATGKMVQPTEEQIGRLTATPPQAGPKAKAPVVTIQGPNGAVGMMLPPESFSYSVATRTADGKIALDCVTGDQAAERIVSKEAGNRKPATQSKGPGDEKK